MWAADHPRSRGVYMTVSPTRSTHGGSSPLARGLRVAVDDQGPRAGIIPARAGFTSGPALPVVGAADHPRSRGVYEVVYGLGEPVRGSSPLARGLRPRVPALGQPCRIIPARAGFTQRSQEHRPASPDHPRSRGVYAVRHRHAPLGQGSSPLARGLLAVTVAVMRSGRIIPARAGFTGRWGSAAECG